MPDTHELAGLEVISGTSGFTGQPFITVRAVAADGTIMFGQLDTATCERQGVIFLQVAEAARHDAALVAMLTDAGMNDQQVGALLLDWRQRCEALGTDPGDDSKGESNDGNDDD